MHGYDDCYCYLPLYVLCGRHLLAAQLRRANRDAAGGAVAEIARMVLQIRARWPRISILLRADAGFARDELMAWCEANAVDYVFALARAQGPVGAIAEELAAAEAESLAQGRPARRFADLPRRTLDSWQRERRVVAKAEHLAKGANPRFIVTLLAARASDARAFYKTSTAPAARSRTGSRLAWLPGATLVVAPERQAARSVRRPHLCRHDARQPTHSKSKISSS